MSRKIEKALGLNPVPMVIKNQMDEDTPKEIINQEQIDRDITKARENVHDALEVAQQAMQDILSIAQQSQHPRAYEVLNSMIKTYADLSMDLANLQMKKQRLQPKSVDAPQQVTNNLFVGSTSEFQDMIDQLRQNKEDEDE